MIGNSHGDGGQKIPGTNVIEILIESICLSENSRAGTSVKETSGNTNLDCNIVYYMTLHSH